jgi:hypothetical protein
VSVRAIGLVWERSRAKGSNFLMLLAIADYAKDDGRWAWPSARLLTWKTRLTGRGGELVLRKLVQDGEVWPEWDAQEKRLYLHVRCACDWDTYQSEGPIPEREKISRSQSEKFSRSLLRIAADRHAKANGATATAKSAAKTSARSSSYDPLDPSVEPSRAREGHRRHVYCPASGDGFCVPEFLHNELQTMLGRRAPEFDLLGWYVDTDTRRRNEQPTVGDPIRWWRDELRTQMQRRGWLIPRGALPDRRADATVASGSTCPHPTRCATISACIERTIREGRAARAAGAVS